MGFHTWRRDSSLYRAAPLALVIGCVLTTVLWSTAGWAQRSRTQQDSDGARAETPVGSPITPIALPVATPSSPLGTALSSCDGKAEGAELVLPAAKGEIKLDRCYRGRDYLVCQFNALAAESKSLLENYRRVVDANYPEVRDIAGICAVAPDTLAADMQSAADFARRFKEFKAEYEARSKCAARIQQSFTQVTFSDMPQAQSLIKSMTDTIEDDVKGVADVQGRLGELADKMAISYRAMLTLQKIQRAMCTGHPNPKVGSSEQNQQ